MGRSMFYHAWSLYMCLRHLKIFTANHKVGNISNRRRTSYFIFKYSTSDSLSSKLTAEAKPWFIWYEEIEVNNIQPSYR